MRLFEEVDPFVKRVEQAFGGKCLQANITRLKPKGAIPYHRDSMPLDLDPESLNAITLTEPMYYFCHNVKWILQKEEQSQMVINGEVLEVKAGDFIDYDSIKPHFAINTSDVYTVALNMYIMPPHLGSSWAAELSEALSAKYRNE